MRREGPRTRLVVFRPVALATAALALATLSPLPAGAAPQETSEATAGRREQSGRAATTESAQARVPVLPGGKSAILRVVVTDENGTAVPQARLTLTPAASGAAIHGETDFAGRAEFRGLAPGRYDVEAEKEGFYVVTGKQIELPATESLEITLPHQQEYHERVTVTAAPPAIDPEQTAAQARLSSEQIINLPYSTTRDIRNAFPLLPGVLPGLNGQVFVAGADATQSYYRLDGFDVSNPVSGLLDLRVSADAVRSVTVDSSRNSAEFGRGSGGLLSMATGMGDDRFRFSATDFVPSFQNRRGIHIEAFTPRVTFSGPISKGKAWFYDAADGEYDLSIVTQLPEGADQAPLWRWSNLSKAQVNLTPTNLLTAGFLINRLTAPHNGLTALSPLETTTDLAQQAYLATVKDQAYHAGGMLLETGFAFNQYDSSSVPRGDLPFVIRPGGTSGNFFETAESTARRYEWLANLYFPSFDWHGTHQFLLGGDFDRIEYHQFLGRGEIQIYREDGTLDRQATFTGAPRFDLNNVEASWFFQDRWAPAKRLLIEPGVRFDWDTILGKALWSPRLASTYMLTPQTKLSFGVGLAYDETNLALFARPLEGGRVETFFGPDGTTMLGQVLTTFRANSSALDEPGYLQWSAGVEQRLPKAVYLRVEYLRKRGTNGLAYQTAGLASNGLPSGLFVLGNIRDDHYDAVTVSARHTFRSGYMLFGSYTRSRARSDAVLDSTLENPLFSPQLPGPLSWDAPNRFLSWGWLPLVRKFMLAYSLDWRTGYPFDVVNQEQELVGLPNRLRFPDYFSLNLHVERRFRLFGFEWAIRGGFNNITARGNPTVVNNNIDSPMFLSFSGERGRSFTGRIRFLGRK
jgi:Carboxypeptidase regulatory-like domain